MIRQIRRNFPRQTFARYGIHSFKYVDSYTCRYWMKFKYRYICYAQSMDLRNPWIFLRKVLIDTLRNEVWIYCAFHGLSVRYIAQSMDQANEVLFCFEVTP